MIAAYQCSAPVITYQGILATGVHWCCDTATLAVMVSIFIVVLLRLSASTLGSTTIPSGDGSIREEWGTMASEVDSFTEALDNTPQVSEPNPWTKTFFFLATSRG